MKRKLTWGSALALAATMVWASTGKPITPMSNTPGMSGSRPNVMVIVADDLDTGTVRTALALDVPHEHSHYIIDTGIRDRLAPINQEDQDLLFKLFANRAASLITLDDLVGEISIGLATPLAPHTTDDLGLSSHASGRCYLVTEPAVDLP